MLTLRKGFTLIELLIVVVIIGILAAIAIPKFTKSKAYKTAMISDLRNLVTAEEAFFSDSGKYSATIDSAHVKFAPSRNVTVTIAPVGSGYWTATASHSQLQSPVVTCGIGMNTTNPTVTTAAEGEPACK